MCVRISTCFAVVFALSSSHIQASSDDSEVLGVCNPLNVCGDADCSTAAKCAALCFGNPACVSRCGGSGCNVGCSPGPCGPGCHLECDPVACPLNICGRLACEPECNPLCVNQYDPCDCYGPCNVLCDPDAAVCNSSCGGDPCNIGCDPGPCGANCFLHCDVVLCPENSCGLPECDPECNPFCDAYDACECDPGPCNLFCDEYDACNCAPGVCNPACSDFDVCACDPDPCNPLCPGYNPCTCATDSCACNPCQEKCAPECEPLCAFRRCDCEPCHCNPCGPMCKPECNPACEEFDPCACWPDPCNPLCNGYDVCACHPCLCEASVADACDCDPCAIGCPNRCTSAECRPECREDCEQYDFCKCMGPCDTSGDAVCFDFCACHPCACDVCSEACLELDPCAGPNCPNFDLCKCNPCLCDTDVDDDGWPNDSDPDFDVCDCQPCRPECRPECNSACPEWDPCKCAPAFCECDPCGPTCFPECNPSCDEFNLIDCLATSICNPRYGGDSVCNPLCGGDPCNSIHCLAFLPACRLASFADCFSGPKRLPPSNGPVTPFDCIRVFDTDDDGDVDLEDIAHYMNNFPFP